MLRFLQVVATLQAVVLPGNPAAFRDFKDASTKYRQCSINAAEYIGVLVRLCGPVGAQKLLPTLVRALPVPERAATLQDVISAAESEGVFNEAVTDSVTPEAGLSVDELHVERLRQFFAAHRPDNASRAPELYAKLGKQIWAGLELKYPGTTAQFTQVSCCVV